jgi:penicillin-binding protein 2
VFVGGISVADYKKLTDPSANDPLVSRAINGEYAPGSTFKLVTSTSDVMDGEDNLTETAACPSSININGEVKTNYDSESPGYDMTLAQALQYSCDTYFYNYAVQEYNNDQNRIAAGKKPLEQLQHMAREFGFASSANVDLPQSEQAVGAISDRETRVANWNTNKKFYCADAKTGYPDEKDLTMRAYLIKLASENCTDGWRYRAGDNADLAIGQGDTLVSPLQLAVAYSAMVNGGTVYNPTIGWAEANTAGKIVKTIQPTVKNKVPVSKNVLKFFENALTFNLTNQPYVSGNIAFLGSPIVTQISGKTGTAQVEGKNDTSWFASWGPTTSSKKFVLVGMVEQTGTGATAAAPMSRAVWEQLLGASGKSLLPGSKPITTLPKVTPTKLAQAAAQAAANAAKSGSASPTATHGSLATATPTITPSVGPASPTVPPSAPAHLVSPDVVPTQTPGKRR